MKKKKRGRRRGGEGEEDSIFVSTLSIPPVFVFRLPNGEKKSGQPPSGSCGNRLAMRESYPEKKKKEKKKKGGEKGDGFRFGLMCRCCESASCPPRKKGGEKRGREKREGKIRERCVELREETASSTKRKKEGEVRV